ncbi:MAG: exonuclease subunit SbcD [Eubacteriales bacterium]|nr:exonuclease subunit SbcD [Eubacteriales bacterium]
MRILHLADLHLGKKLNDLSLIQEQEYFLNWVLELLEEREIDSLILAGDIYDRSVPPGEAIRLLDHFLTQLVELDKAVFIIPGNHDSAERLAFAAEVLKAKKIFIAGRSPEFLERYILEVKGLKVCFDLLPFLRAVDLLRLDPEAKLLSSEAAVQASLEKNPPPPELPAVLLAHQFVIGSALAPELGKSERAYVGPADQISAELFAAYDYVALGHIHRPQAVGRETCRYAGAPMPFRFGEEMIVRSCPIIEFSAGSKEPKIELVEIPQSRKMISKTASFKEIKELLLSGSPEAIELQEAYCEIVLTDRTVPDRAFASLKESLPYLINLRFVGLGTKTGSIPTESPDKLSLLDLFSSFYLENTGLELEAPLRARLKQEIAIFESGECREECDH